jgi:hypothetical protein
MRSVRFATPTAGKEQEQRRLDGLQRRQDRLRRVPDLCSKSVEDPALSRQQEEMEVVLLPQSPGPGSFLSYARIAAPGRTSRRRPA